MPPTIARSLAADVHVWVLRLPPAPDRLARLETHLQRAEHERAQRFRREEDRARFVATRGHLRELLGAQLGVAPARVRLAASPQGKPALDMGPAAEELRFNAAHSGERAAIVLARGREVGVDVERVREELALESLAGRVLSPAEQAFWRDLNENERSAAFFAAWARKEAYVKGVGEGLALGLETIEPQAGPRSGRWLVAAGRRRWAVEDLEAGPGYAAAVAATGEDWELRVEPGPE